MEEVKKTVCKAEDNIGKWAEDISDYIFNNPEVSDEEYKSSGTLFVSGD